MELVAREKDGVLYLSFIGQFWEREDVREVQSFFSTNTGETKRVVVVNLERLTFIGSIGLGAIMNLYSQLKEEECRLILFRPNGSVKESMELAGFPTIVPVVYDSEELERSLAPQA